MMNALGMIVTALLVIPYAVWLEARYQWDCFLMWWNYR